MVGILIDYDLIAGPVPVRDDVVIERGDVPEEIAEPEALPVPSRKHEGMLRPKATGEASMCPRVIEVIIRIVGATTMSDPLIVLRVNVRNFRMTFLVRCNVIPGRGGRRALRCGSGCSRWSRTVSGNMSTANRLVAATARLVVTLLTLRRSSQANQDEQSNRCFHCHLLGDNSPVHFCGFSKPIVLSSPIANCRMCFKRPSSKPSCQTCRRTGPQPIGNAGQPAP
jgi:hypothetical protein